MKRKNNKKEKIEEVISKEELYFSTPIWMEKNNSFLELLKIPCNEHIDTAKKKNKKLIKDNKDFGFSNHSDQIQYDTRIQEFTSYVGQKSCDFLSSQGFDLSNHTVVFTEMWVQEFAKKGGHHEQHLHGNNHVSGFYFLACSEHTSSPTFYDPRPGALMTKLPINPGINHAIDAVHFKPTPGTMMIFNSYVPHSFSLDHGKEPFRFIHWNCQAVPNILLKR
jgi:uncharacterized protein (TIGR02466 family)